MKIEKEEGNVMKKRILTALLAMVVCIIGIWGMKTDARAEDTGEELDFSYLLTEETLVGKAEMQTWGVYLAEGNSFINKMATGKIGAGGNTIAATKCKVSVTSIVERLANGSWVRVTSWTMTTTSGYSASVSRALSVGTGYYYRVRSSHYASSDASSSCTSSLWMGN